MQTHRIAAPEIPRDFDAARKCAAMPLGNTPRFALSRAGTVQARVRRGIAYNYVLCAAREQESLLQATAHGDLIFLTRFF